MAQNDISLLEGQPDHKVNIDMFHDSLELTFSSLQMLQLCCYIKLNGHVTKMEHGHKNPLAFKNSA